jgi:hypothetical protein
MIFQIHQRVFRPHVIIRERTQREDTYKVIERQDTCLRVSPSNAKEVLALQLLEHGVDKFAPAAGNGVVITQEAHRKLNAPTSF